MPELSQQDANTFTTESGVHTSSHGYQAYQILHVGYVLLPTIVGLDKFVHWIANWTGYLAPAVARMLPVSPGTFMRITGVVEILAGLLVAVRPRWGGYVVAAWLAGIVVNLLLARDFYDVALRDVGLMFGAIALARLAQTYDTGTLFRHARSARDSG